MNKKNIVITGASGGVGSLLSKGLAKNGHHIICLGRREKALKELVEDIQSEGGSASFGIVDMMNDVQLVAVVESIIKESDRIDVWINNVGVNNHNAIGPTWELEPKNWWKEVSLNLYTAFVGTRTAINVMKEGNSGYIINLGGGGVQKPKPYGSSYGAAKTAVVKFSETVNLELEEENLNIKVFAFNPGFIRNDRTEELVESNVARKYMPELEQILKYGEMSDIQDSIDLIETIISGKADMLAGKYFFSDDKNIQEAIDNAETFIKETRNLLRVKV
ncbi:SDR family NAD(P)-dependent oxidoreductase [Seonamhaeicola maritimus]|uniref:SDR family oxidoreductase n=1 Tax=Seonamhaeicola maritimus TaxID=2591822 RepID=A0A5C7GFY0_9FLAO|nr:SDR family oxidoreductase [Seonamhaeicola maritimus]TXG35400.1 SDR family oxidoreductase [Seonamhaeicola maritimus]